VLAELGRRRRQLLAQRAQLGDVALRRVERLVLVLVDADDALEEVAGCTKR